MRINKIRLAIIWWSYQFKRWNVIFVTRTDVKLLLKYCLVVWISQSKFPRSLTSIMSSSSDSLSAKLSGEIIQKKYTWPKAYFHWSFSQGGKIHRAIGPVSDSKMACLVQPGGIKHNYYVLHAQGEVILKTNYTSILRRADGNWNDTTDF